MNMFSSIFRNKSWDVDEIPKVWDNRRTPIYEFIMTELSKDDKAFLEGGKDSPKDLPDTDTYYKDDESFKWVSGGQDGAFFCNYGFGHAPKLAEQVFSHIKKITAVEKPNKDDLISLYNLLQKNHTLDYFMDLAQLLIDDENLDFPKVMNLALWLVYYAPDREPVKLGIALLDLSASSSEFKTIFIIYAAHDEFALFAALALSDLEKDSELTLWNAAKRVNGWGKIHLVKCLARKNISDELKQWLLREGYKNIVMYEYLAYTCAEAGNLLEVLRSSKPDYDLFIGAGEILVALINGGPAKGIDDYKDGAQALKLYVNWLSDRMPSIKHFRIIYQIYAFVTSIANDEEVWQKRYQDGWSEEFRKGIETSIHMLLSDPIWIEIMWAELKSEKQENFFDACQIARYLEIDIWDFYYERQKAFGGMYWDKLLSTTDLNKVDQTLELARDKVGKEGNYYLLSFVCKGLQAFPGKGYDLIKLALQSKEVSDRYKALRTLDQWGQEHWPVDTKMLLNMMCDNETEEGVRNLISKVINDEEVTGKTRPSPIPDDWVGRKLKSGKKGYCWYDPKSDGNAVFIYRDYDKDDYAIVVKDGVQLNREGNPIPGTYMLDD